MRRFVAIAVVWLGCAVAWVVLGSTLLVRSGEVSRSLVGEVHGLWGAPMVQRPPQALVPSEGSGPAMQTVAGALDGSNVEVALDLEQRKKGLLWFPTYAVDFRGRYRFVNQSPEPRTLEIQFPLETQGALYDGFAVRTADGKPVSASIDNGVARWSARFAPGQKRTFVVKFQSRGTKSWQYQLTAGTGQVRDFRLAMSTDFPEVDFASGTLSPGSHHVAGGSWHGLWTFENLVASAPIGIELPQRLNPGPLAAQITFFAPVSLLFFFFVVAILAEHRGHYIHPVNYFFIGCAFFAFHLLFSYLVDHVSVLPSFLIASGVSVALVVSYARLFVGNRFALREMGIAQVIYLVLFSFTFFWSGFTGLTITVVAILTLALMMQITGRKRPEPELADAKCGAPYRCAMSAETTP